MAFSLTAVFGVDATGVKTEIKQLRKELNSFVQDYAKLGAGLAVGAFVALSKGALDLASNLKDTSLQIGINVEALQALQYAATQNGSSTESMTKALTKLRLGTKEAADGNKELNEALATLGLNAKQVAALPLEQQYVALGKAYQSATDKSAAYNAVCRIFGEKIGPDQLQVLQALAADGYPKVADAAAKAGQVMSAETIVALERAQQAIDDFKQRATVAVGNIIVNFRSEEGLQLLLFQLLRVAGNFGAKIVDALVDAGGMIKAVIGGELTWVANKFRDRFLTGIADAAKLLNQVLPDRFHIDVAGIEAMKSAGKAMGDTLADALANTKPSTFTKDVSEYWDRVVADRQKVVDQLNKVDLTPDADKLRAAGAAFAAQISTINPQAATQLKEAADYFTAQIDRANLGPAAEQLKAAANAYVSEINQAALARDADKLRAAGVAFAATLDKIDLGPAGNMLREAGLAFVSTVGRIDLGKPASQLQTAAADFLGALKKAELGPGAKELKAAAADFAATLGKASIAKDAGALKSAGADFVATINKIDLGPSGAQLKKSATDFVDQLNKVDLAKDATLLTEAASFFATNVQTSAEKYRSSLAAANAATLQAAAAKNESAEAQRDAAEAQRLAALTTGEALADAAVPWAEAQRRWSDTIKEMVEATHAMGALIAGIRGGSVFNDLSDAALEEVIRQNRAKARDLQYEAKSKGIQSGDNVGLNIEAGRLEAEALNAQQQLDVRNRFRRDIDLLGVEGARRRYEPELFERLLRQLGPDGYKEQEKQTDLLQEIRDGQRRMTDSFTAGLKDLSRRT